MKSTKTIKVTENNYRRTFTLRIFENGKLLHKYRTPKLTKEEFNDCYYNTVNDWINYINQGNCTYIN